MSRYIYPRLPLGQSEARLVEVARAYETGGLAGTAQLASLESSKAAPAPTGGKVAGPDRLAQVRASAMEAIYPWYTAGFVPREEVHQFDLSLGASLHKSLQIVPADGAHTDTWSFLSLIVMPDISALRFPSLHRTRMLGLPRNALRRPWLRQEVLGDLLIADVSLGEDTLVGLFERTALSRNRVLIREMARQLIEYEGPIARSLLARELSKRVVLATGPYLLDARSPSEVAALVSDAIQKSEGTLRAGKVSEASRD